MWNVFAIDNSGECVKVNDTPLSGEEVGQLIDLLENITTLILNPAAWAIDQSG